MADEAISNEIWKDIPEWEGLYEVSSLGRVRNRHGLILKRRIQWTGYNAAVLWKNNVGKPYFVHRLVCAAIIGPRPERYDVNHIDGDRLNNSVENLEYVTRSQNQLHRRVTGTAALGEMNGQSKLTAENVLEIRKLRAEGVRRITLASRYRVSVYLITAITSRKIWTHI